MPMRPPLVWFGLLAAALAVGASACQWPRGAPHEAVEQAPPPQPWREPRTAAPPRETPLPEPIAPLIERGSGSFVRSLARAAGATIARNAAGEVTLNVVDGDLREVVRMVLQDGLGVNYVIDPAVQGTVTVQTSEPVRAEDLVAILDAILRVNGAALVRTGDLFKVVPLDAALASGAPPAIQRLPDAGAPGFGIRVVPLQFATAAKLAELLAPFAPPGGVLQLDPVRNILLLAGSPAELNTLSELVTMFDVDWLAGMSFGLFPLEEAEALELATELEAVFGSEEGGPLTDIVRFIPIERLNAILVVSAQPAYLDRAQTWIERLDRIGEGVEPRIFVYAVQNGRATDLAEVLGEVFGIPTATVGEADLLAPGLEPIELGTSGFERDESGIGAQGDVAEELPADREPRAGREPQQPGMRRAPDALRPSRAGAPQEDREIRVIADDTTNSLVIRATPRDYRQIREALAELDIIRLQVLIEATIAEVTLNGQLRYGVEWFFRFGDVSFTFSRLEAPGNITGNFPGFSALLDSSDVVAVFNALERITDVNVISSPHLLVLDNQTALLQVGDEVPIATQQAQSVTDPDAPLVNSIEQRDTGVILSVTPRVNASGLVFMEIEQESSRPVQTVTSELDSPTIQQRRVASTVAVQSGEAVVLGGLIQDRVEQRDTGVPILHRLPIIGPLFGVTDTINDRTELLVVLTPRVIRNPEQARAVTEELRRRLRGLVPLEARVR
jgi:general secretion pathway protein D